MNTPSVATSRVSPVTVSRNVTPVTASSPWISSIVAFHTTSILGLASARSCMIFDARNSSRRCTIVTLEANFVRNVASSIAESPPPTTISSRSLKKNPSQVAQALTPRPRSCCSPGMSSHFALAPVATMIVSVCHVWSPAFTVNGRALRSTSVTCTGRISAPNRAACFSNCSMSSGPRMPSMNPG